MKLIILRSAQKDLDKLPDEIVLRLSDKIFKLKENPYGQNSEKLAGGKGYRIRVGDYRMVYTVDKTNKTIAIIKIGHRKEVYRN